MDLKYSIEFMDCVINALGLASSLFLILALFSILLGNDKSSLMKLLKLCPDKVLIVVVGEVLNILFPIIGLSPRSMRILWTPAIIESVTNCNTEIRFLSYSLHVQLIGFDIPIFFSIETIIKFDTRGMPRTLSVKCIPSIYSDIRLVLDRKRSIRHHVGHGIAREAKAARREAC